MSKNRAMSYSIVKSGTARIEIMDGKTYGDVYFPIPWIDDWDNYENIQIQATQFIPDSGLPINKDSPKFNLYVEINKSKKEFRIVAVELNNRPQNNYSVHFSYIVSEYRY